MTADPLPWTVYGKDDRLEYYEVMYTSREPTVRASAALMAPRQLVPIASGFRIHATSMNEAHNLCPDQKFGEQPVASFCSGTLVGEDLILTAGHCLTSPTCRGYRVVFDYRLDRKNQSTFTVQESDVYRCQQVVAYEMKKDLDYALIRLDRKVRGRTPVAMTRFSEEWAGTEIFSVGYPLGIPLKVAPNGKIHRVDGSYYVTDLDTSFGNSGSGVFNWNNQLIGVLIQGDQDFVYDRSARCRRVKTCKFSECLGEDVLKLDMIRKDLQNKNIVPL